MSETGTCSVVVNLESNDDIYVTNSGISKVKYPEIYNSFSGILLYRSA